MTDSEHLGVVLIALILMVGLIGVSFAVDRRLDALEADPPNNIIIVREAGEPCGWNGVARVELRDGSC